MIKKSVKHLFNLLGLEIRKNNGSFNRFNAHYLTQLCDPRTVIDVGVGTGTPELYKAYPRAHIILIEPMRDFAQYIDKITEAYDASVYYKAVSDAEGSVELLGDAKDPHKSSFSTRTALSRTGNQLDKLIVEVTTLDQILVENPGMLSPIVLKIDTEGHELAVIRGACELLRKVDMVIMEVSIAPQFEGGYAFEDIIQEMKMLNFSVYSFLSVNNVGNELRQRYTDVIFTRNIVEAG
jgi:FkbM family methyltransferase